MTKLLVPICLASAAFFFCFPMAFVFAGSFMGNAELQRHLSGIVSSGRGFANLPLIPQYPSLESYIAVLIDTPEFHVLFWNSVIIVLAILAGQAVISFPAAWAFARYRFLGGRVLFFLYVVIMMMPFQVMLLPEYLVLTNLGFLNTPFAIILPGIFSALPIFILYHFFRSIPQSVLDAARLDGANELQVFLRIGLPLAKPGIFAMLLLSFIEYWNLIEQPLVFLRDKTTWPLSLFLPAMGLEQAGVVFAAVVITCIPSLIAFMLGRSYFEQGIAIMTKKG